MTSVRWAASWSEQKPAATWPFAGWFGRPCFKACFTPFSLLYPCQSPVDVFKKNKKTIAAQWDVKASSFETCQNCVY